MTEPRVVCPYCTCPARLVAGDVVYPHRTDLHAKRLWYCGPCRAWVGVHDGTTRPLGRLANAELRRAKQRAHAAFDPLWLDSISRREARKREYAWLARELGIENPHCHIGEFDVATCYRVVEICARRR